MFFGVSTLLMIFLDKLGRRAASTFGKFDWKDPLLLERLLTEEEIMIKLNIIIFYFFNSLLSKNINS